MIVVKLKKKKVLLVIIQHAGQPHASTSECRRNLTLENGLITYNWGRSVNQTRVRLLATPHCNVGYELKNDSVFQRECSMDGVWNGKDHECVGKVQQS